ncbi:MAG: GNAT family N-acetyltransferase [Bacteroidota bacterium]
MHLPPYEPFPALNGAHVSLRQITTADIPDIIEISYYDAIQAGSVEQAISMQEKINLDYVTGNSIHWGIVSNQTNRIAGTCGYYRGFKNGEGELGCVLLSQYSGKGLMTHAMQLAIDFGFNTVGLTRIYAVTSTTNHKAIALFSRLDFKQVAIVEDDVEFELRSHAEILQNI